MACQTVDPFSDSLGLIPVIKAIRATGRGASGASLSTRPEDDRGAARKGRPFWRSYFTIGQQRWLDQHQRQSHIHAIGDRWPDTLATQRPPH